MSKSVGAVLKSFDFEVFGKVQGVFFRKYTQSTAQSLGLVGYCLNTKEGSVKGQAQGAEDGVGKMMHWLEHEGSPQSRISNAVFRNIKVIPSVEYQSFEVRRGKF